MNIELLVSRSNQIVISCFFIFCVYLPGTNCNTELYNEYIDKLYSIYEEYSALGTVIFLGDFNTEISGTRYLARNGKREKILDSFLKKQKFVFPNFRYTL